MQISAWGRNLRFTAMPSEVPEMSISADQVPQPFECFSRANARAFNLWHWHQFATLERSSLPRNLRHNQVATSKLKFTAQGFTPPWVAGTKLRQMGHPATSQHYGKTPLLPRWWGQLQLTCCWRIHKTHISGKLVTRSWNLPVGCVLRSHLYKAATAHDGCQSHQTDPLSSSKCSEMWAIAELPVISCRQANLTNYLIKRSLVSNLWFWGCNWIMELNLVPEISR